MSLYIVLQNSTIKKGMMQLLDLPMEIFYYDLLRYFRWNDLLRFKRVCSTLSGYTDAFIRAGRRLPPFEIQVCDDKPISDLLRIDVPIRRIYFKNYPTGAKLFENCSQVPTFLNKFGSSITHVRFHSLSVHLFLNENRQFLEGLSKLESLEFETVGPATSEDGNKALTLQQIHTLQNLKSLKIEASLPVACIYDLMLIATLKRQCGAQIEYLSLPRIATFWERDTGDLLQSVRRSTKPTLKYFDFGTFSEKGTYGNLCLDADIRWPQFPEICNALVAANVKLLNVPAGYFENYYLMNNNPDVWEVESQEKVGKAVMSLVNLHLAVNDLEMPNLEKITFTSPKRTSIFSRYDAARRPLWPSLRILDITIDSKRLAPTGLFPATVTYTEALLHFLFVGICRPAVDQLCLRYSDNVEDLPVPKSEYLISACPYLKKLVLVNWQGTNRSLAQLWAGLPHLENVHLERCTSLGNVAFFGEDVERPVFLKLEKLKSLTLKGLEHMPKISDTLFRLIIRLLKLKQFTLEGGHETPLKNITISGIRALLSGPFAQSIEKFSLKNVNLAYVGEEEMRRLEKQFRSYNML